MCKKITTRLHKVGTSPPEGKGGGGGDAHLICNHVMISPAAGLRILFLTYLDFGILKTFVKTE